MYYWVCAVWEKRKYFFFNQMNCVQRTLQLDPFHWSILEWDKKKKNAAQSCRSLATADPHLLVIIFMFMCQDAPSSVQVWCSTVALVVKLHQGCSNIKQSSSPIIMEDENQELSWVRWPYVLGACTAFGLTTLKQNRYVITDMYYKAS